jgi:hypothetical protein
MRSHGMEKIVILYSAAVSDPNSYIPRSRVDDNEECNSFFWCICPQALYLHDFQSFLKMLLFCCSLPWQNISELPRVADTSPTYL